MYQRNKVIFGNFSIILVQPSLNDTDLDIRNLLTHYFHTNKSKIKTENHLKVIRFVFQQKNFQFRVALVYNKRIYRRKDMKGKKLLSNVYCTDHPSQKLNLVCINPRCSQKGLICSLCKNDPYSLNQVHQDHLNKVVPFKYLIQSLQSSFDTFEELGTNSTLEYKYLKKLEAVRDQSLFFLEIMTNNLATFAQKVEERVIESYQNNKSSIMYRSQTLRKLKKVIEKAVLHDMRKEQKYELINEVKVLVGFIKENEGLTSKSKYELDINPSATLARFIQQKQNLKLNCDVLEEFVKKLNEENIEINVEDIRLSKKERKNLAKMADLSGQIEKLQFSNFEESENLKKIDSNEFPKQQLVLETVEKKTNIKPNFSQRKKDEKYSHLNWKSALTDLDQEGLKKISKSFKGTPIKIQQNTSKKKKIQLSEEDLQKKEKMLLIEQKQYQMKEKELKSSKIYKLFENMNDDDDEEEEEDKKKQKQKYKHFSEHLKGYIDYKHRNGIHLTSHGVQAKLTGNSGLVLLEESLDTCRSITFKIAKFRSHILIGLAFSDVLATNHFAYHLPLPLKKFSSGNHGIIGVDQAGHCLFHAKPQENCLIKDFSFEQRDLITLNYSEGSLWIQKATNKKHKNVESVHFPLKIHENELKDYRFCAYLGGKDDSVRIL